jgi:hypothetical protein
MSAPIVTSAPDPYAIEQHHPGIPGVGHHPDDKHLIAQFWTGLAPDQLSTFVARPERDIVSSLRGSTVGALTINGNPAGRDLLRYVRHYWQTAPGPSHLHVHRAVQKYRRRMSAMHTAYNRKRASR